MRIPYWAPGSLADAILTPTCHDCRGSCGKSMFRTAEIENDAKQAKAINE